LLTAIVIDAHSDIGVALFDACVIRLAARTPGAEILDLCTVPSGILSLGRRKCGNGNGGGKRNAGNRSAK
jgi:hypothetical protein